jgi:hypothetical protein
MRLTVHSLADGSIRDVVLQPDGEIRVNLVPEPGMTVSDITDHDFHGDVDREKLARLHEDYKVEVAPAKGKLVYHRKDE